MGASSTRGDRLDGGCGPQLNRRNFIRTVGGFDDVSLNFAAAPEPSTWAMMIAGLAFLGFRLHRRSLFRS